MAPRGRLINRGSVEVSEDEELKESGDVGLRRVQDQLIIGGGTAGGPTANNEAVEAAGQLPFKLVQFNALGRGDFWTIRN